MANFVKGLASGLRKAVAAATVEGKSRVAELNAKRTKGYGGFAQPWAPVKPVGGLTKEKVGEDVDGNQYYVFHDQGKQTTRRYVDYKAPLYDVRTSQLHILWWQWLQKTRHDPPTPEEVAAHDAKQHQLKARVAALEAEDAKLRMQEQIERRLQEADGTYEQPDMSADAFVAGHVARGGRPDGKSE